MAIDRKACFQKQLLDMSNAIDELEEQYGDTYTKEQIDTKFYSKEQANTKFVSKTNLTDFSINDIIVADSEIQSGAVDLRAVSSQEVKSEVSLDPTSTIIRTMSGTDTSTIGISGTEIDVTTSMFKYNSNEVATKNEIPTDTSDLTNNAGFITIADVPVPTPGTGINITNGQISVDNTVAMKTDLPHLYQHNIVGMTTDTEDFVLFSFINTTSTAMTYDQVREWLYDNGFTGEGMNGKHYLPATGRCSADSFEFDYTPPDLPTTSDYCESVVVGVRATDEEDNNIKALVSKLKEKDSGTDAYEEDYMSISNSFTDTVVTLC